MLLICFNHEKYIREAISSVVCQNFVFPFEIIVCDDNSKDRSVAIANEALESSGLPFMIVGGENVGVAKSILRGASVARYDLIFTLECDDFWINANKMQAQLEAMLHWNAHSSCHYFNVVDENGEFLRNQERLLYNTGFLDCDDVLCNFPMHLGSISFFRSKCPLIFEHDYSDFGTIFDLPFAFYLACQKKMLLIPNVWISYRAHAEGWWTSKESGMRLRLRYAVIQNIIRQSSLRLPLSRRCLEGLFVQEKILCFFDNSNPACKRLWPIFSWRFISHRMGRSFFIKALLSKIFGMTIK